MPYINDEIRVSIETFEDLDMNPVQANFYNFLRDCLEKGNKLIVYRSSFEENAKLTSISTLEHFEAFIRSIGVAIL